MTAPTWADRSLPLAERVRLAMLDWDVTDATEAHRTELLADVAAAAAMANMASRVERLDARPDTPYVLRARSVAYDEYDEALAAYRDRMAQGVGDA